MAATEAWMGGISKLAGFCCILMLIMALGATAGGVLIALTICRKDSMSS
jgi:hypothetical protein